MVHLTLTLAIDLDLSVSESLITTFEIVNIPEFFQNLSYFWQFLSSWD